MAINTREGSTWEDDMPCERLQTDPIAVGKFKGEVLEPEPFKEMLKAYYKLVGADPETGRPDYDALVDLSMPEVAEELVALGKIPRTKENTEQGDGN
jgi:aldehyde:ferredoxin oxidoreductase